MEEAVAAALPSLIAFVFPAYQSHLAWKNNDEKEKLLWVRYWCISGLVIVLIDAFSVGSIDLYEMFKIGLFAFAASPFDGIISPETRLWGAVMGLAEHLSFMWRGAIGFK